MKHNHGAQSSYYSTTLESLAHPTLKLFDFVFIKVLSEITLAEVGDKLKNTVNLDTDTSIILCIWQNEGSHTK